MTATIELGDEVPRWARDILTALPGVKVVQGARENVLRINGDSRSLALLTGGIRPFAKATAPMLATMAGDKLGFVIADRLPAHVRKELEDAGCAYTDGTGAAHITLPGFFLHMEGKPTRRASVTPPPAGIGVVGVRTVQTLLAGPSREWSVADLAREAGCAAGEAHRVLTRLETEGLVTGTGRARNLRRTVRNPGDSWTGSPRCLRLGEPASVCTAFLYTPEPDGLVTYISAYGFQAELTYAFTGTAAAHVYGATVTTAVPVTTLRVDPDVPLKEACTRLHAEPVDSGPNLALVRDLGEVGIHGRQFNGHPLAPPARVWLDMLDEPRGEDAAALFREAVIGW